MLFVMFMFGVVILILFLLLVKRVVIRCYFFDELNYVFFHGSITSIRLCLR